MEEFVIEFVSFVQVLLLHLVPNITVFAVGCWNALVMSGSLDK